MKINIPALSQYKNFSVLRSIDAASERVGVLKDILHLKNNNELILIGKTNPRFILSSIGRLYKEIGPRSIGVNPTPLCNRRCQFCSSMQRNKINIEDGIEINERTLRKLLEDFSSMKGQGCVLVGGGEALLSCGGRLNEVIADFPLHYGFNTNGVNLGKFKHLCLLNKIAWISLSIIAHNKTLYNKVAGLQENDIQFDTLHKNLKEYLHLASDLEKNKKEYPYISAKILICRENYLFAGDIYNYVRNMGFKDIALRCVNNFELRENYRGRILNPQDVELFPSQKKELKEILIQQTDLSEDIIKDIVKKRGESREFSNIPTLCWNILLGLIANVDTDGEVYLCNPRLGLENFRA